MLKRELGDNDLGKPGKRIKTMKTMQGVINKELFQHILNL